MLRIATRGSALARRQAARVVERLGGPDHELVIITTTGDARTDVPIHELGGQGVFVKEVQHAVLDGRADLAVHSAKDLPGVTVDGLVIGAFPERADVRDALVGARLADLEPGATVATGAVRRRAQLAALRPDLVFVELRGNIDTRLAKAVDVGAVVVAAAALERLGRTHAITEYLEPAVLLPQVGQGALAVECRIDDRRAQQLLATIDDPVVRRTVGAERSFLRALGGGCELPVGALATITPDGRIDLEVLLADAGGVRRARVLGPHPDALGRAALAALETTRTAR